MTETIVERENRPAKLKEGQKQPDHTKQQTDVTERIAGLRESLSVETRASSAERSKESGNLRKDDDRTAALGPQINAAEATAAAHLVAAENALLVGDTADAALESDPRRERDQEIFRLGQAGKLGDVQRHEGVDVEAQAAADLVILKEAAEQVPGASKDGESAKTDDKTNTPGASPSFPSSQK